MNNIYKKIYRNNIFYCLYSFKFKYNNKLNIIIIIYILYIIFIQKNIKSLSKYNFCEKNIKKYGLN